MAARKSETNIYTTILPTKTQTITVTISNKCNSILCIADNAFGYEFQSRNNHIVPNIDRRRHIEVGMANFHFL